MSLERKAEKQAAYERRLEARRLLFERNNGMMKNLTLKQKRFVRAVCRESYNAYLEELRTGISRWRYKGPKWRKPLNPNRGRTMTFNEYRRIWWKGNKAVYRRRDVPRMMRDRIERMRSCGVEGAA